MTDRDAPADLDVRLEWPQVETPAVTKKPPPETSPPRRKTRRQQQALVPQRRGRSGSAEDMRAQMDALARLVSKLSATDIDQLSTRVEDLAAAVGGRRTDAQVKRTSTDIKALAKRMDSMARAIEALPNGSAIAELVGRVDMLARTVESLGQQVSSGARFDALKGHVADTLEPLHEATSQVRRLTDTVSNAMVSRSDRQVELRTQVQTLAGEVRELRRTLPTGKVDPGIGVVEAVTDAVKAALASEPTAASTPPRKKPPARKAQAKKAQAKKAQAKKAAAKKAAAKKTAAKKTAAKKTMARRRSRRTANAKT